MTSPLGSRGAHKSIKIVEKMEKIATPIRGRKKFASSSDSPDFRNLHVGVVSVGVVFDV